jgi:membrane-bound lytic murein transglycosylase D
MTRDDPTIDRATAFLLSDPKGRIAFHEALTRSGRWSAEVTRVFDIWKIPHAWLALALIQSGFQPSAASDTGGAGIWQLTPDVAHVYGLAMLPTYDERKAVAASTEATARYLGDLYARFGSWELAILAFRWGYRTTLSELQKNASTDFWQLVPRLDDQGVRFVSRVFATARILENLDLLSLDSIRRDAPANTSDLDVSPGTPFALIARAARIDVALLRELNPEFSSDSVPQANFTINVRVPSDTLTSARSRLPGVLRGTTDETEPKGVPTTKDVDPNTHHAITRGSQRRELYTTKEGDTLDSLSRRYRIPLDVLASDNARDPTSSLNPGTIIAIRVENAPPIPSSAPPARRKKTH